MASSTEFIDFVCSQIEAAGIVRAKKMFGDYCIYVDEKPTLLVCDNIVYIKKHHAIAHLMQDAECGFPYEGAKEHYILDIDHREEAVNVIKVLLPHLSYPKPKTNHKYILNSDALAVTLGYRF
ncbi:MAG: TfoX/Sxy family protein [Bacteroidales bacterium]|nr:TfoX/Sxy family protein [Candidatus Colicola coprequi]